MSILSITFVSAKTSREISRISKAINNGKKLKDHFEFSGSMRVIEKLMENEVISRSDFDSACTRWERGDFIETVKIKCVSNSKCA